MRKKVYKNLKCTMLLFVWLACSVAVLAQERQVTGSIKDANGDGLPGVNVLVKGTTTGTTTNVEGKFSIQAASNATLVFSFIGYRTQEAALGNRNSVDVVLAEDMTELSEVVVTALGVERSAKSLQSSITKVAGSSLTVARENNLGASLQGRAAGVNVTKAASGPGGSSRVIIRGNKSLGGSNQPLYVIDGIPMDNTQYGQVGVWGGTDQGDGLSSIDPENIESVTILKGAAAAALYGARAGFGVINVTTKRGGQKKGLGIDFNSNYVAETVYRFDDTQQIYGPGGMKVNPADPTGSQIASKPASQLEAWNWGNMSMWGPKFDGSPVPQFDGVLRSYSFAGDNWKRFYQTGNSFTNTLAITGGGDNQTYRFSISDLKNTFVVPNSKFARKNASLSTTGKFGRKITYNAKVIYSNEKMNNRSMLGDSPGNAPLSVFGLASNTNIMDLMGDPNKPGAIPVGVATPDLKVPGEEFQQSNNNWNQNPWWSAYQITNENIRDRYITSVNLRYNILDWLSVQAQVGMDYFARNNNSLTPEGTGYQRRGAKSESVQFQREINQEFTIRADREFGKIRVNGFVGGNKMTREGESISANGANFNVPFFAAVGNTANQNFGYGYNQSGINSLFGSAEVSYGDYLFLTATARKDWFSVLNPAVNNKLYPSVGGSFVFSDAFKSSLPEWLSFGKLRAAWGQVASANVGAYSVVPSYGLLGQGHLGIPMGTFGFGDNIPNPLLTPALSSEIELGTELRFLHGRAGIEFTYYNQKTTDDILSSTISQSSGFNSASINVGEITNKGIELMVFGTPVQGAFTWDISLNMARNRNMVNELSPGVTRLFVDEPRTRNAGVYHVKGQPFGMILGFVQKTDPATGKKVYDINGLPVRSDLMEILGNGIADLTGGLTNTLSYKRFKFDVLMDFKFGGDIYSGTETNLYGAGLSKKTLPYREGGLPVEGVIQTGTGTDGKPVYSPFSKVLNEQQTRNYYGNTASRAQEQFVYDASYIKLRQFSIDYSLPTSILGKTPLRSVSLALVGRHLLTFFRKTDNIDPEASYTSGNGQGIDQFGMPSTRTYGFNIRTTF